MDRNRPTTVHKFAISEAAFGGNVPCDKKIDNIEKLVMNLFGKNLRTLCKEELSLQLSHRSHATIAGGLINGGGQLWNPEQHGPQVSDGARHESLSEAEVEQQLKELFDECNAYIGKTLTKRKKFTLAAYFIYRYLAIHPYSDGNGRVARQLTWVLLMQLGEVTQPLRLDLPRNSRQRYVDGLNQGRVTNPWQSAGQLEILTDLFMEAADLGGAQVTDPWQSAGQPKTDLFMEAADLGGAQVTVGLQQRLLLVAAT